MVLKTCSVKKEIWFPIHSTKNNQFYVFEYSGVAFENGKNTIHAKWEKYQPLLSKQEVS